MVIAKSLEAAKDLWALGPAGRQSREGDCQWLPHRPLRGLISFLPTKSLPLTSSRQFTLISSLSLLFFLLSPSHHLLTPAVYKNEAKFYWGTWC